MLGRPGCIPAGEVIEANFASSAPRFIKPTKQTGSRRAGVVYETKAQGYILRKLEEKFGRQIEIKASPWIRFKSRGDEPGQVRYCQPDCVFFDEWERKITIVEIKLQHCIEAYNQVRKLYEPVLTFMFPKYLVSALEIVQWHDPHTQFPEIYYFEPDIFQSQAHRFAVHIWNPRYDNIPAPSTRQSTPVFLPKLS